VLLLSGSRLGIFGYLGSKELRRRTVDGMTGHYGQTDQRLAMEWVKANIAAFGGDPQRVMIFGQSSGAGSVSTHLVTPKSWGLFHAAGMASGAFGTWISAPLVAEPPLLPGAGAQITFDKFVNESNCNIAAIRQRYKTSRAAENSVTAAVPVDARRRLLHDEQEDYNSLQVRILFDSEEAGDDTSDPDSGEQTVFLSHLYLKTMIFQDRLGTNIRKALKKRAFPHQTQIQMRSMRSCLVSSSFPQKKS
jgi:hypothetical protein